MQISPGAFSAVLKNIFQRRYACFCCLAASARGEAEYVLDEVRHFPHKRAPCIDAQAEVLGGERRTRRTACSRPTSVPHDWKLDTGQREASKGSLSVG